MFTAKNNEIQRDAAEDSNGVRVGLDRIQLLAWPRGSDLPHIPGFSVRHNRFVRSQTAVNTYGRVCTLENFISGTRCFIQYVPLLPWLPPAKVTVVPNDLAGLKRTEAERIARTFGEVRPNLVELTVDFSVATVVNRTFVLRHGMFGGSHLIGGRLLGDLRFGARHSPTMTRAYQKPEISAYRVEPELHGPWLKAHGIISIDDLYELGHIVWPRRICFVEIDWDRLATHLLRQGREASRLIRAAQLRDSSIHRALTYIRHNIGVHNVRRFTRYLPINAEIRCALRLWAIEWRRGGEDAE